MIIMFFILFIPSIYFLQIYANIANAFTKFIMQMIIKYVEIINFH